MRITQGTFSCLPPLTDTQIRAQIEYMIQPRTMVDAMGIVIHYQWAVSIEFTDDPHPRNVYWNMWGLPMFDLTSADPVTAEIEACRKAHPNCYIKVNGYDPSPLRQGQALSFIVHRPAADEKGYRLLRTEVAGQVIQYELQPYVIDRPPGERYSGDGLGRQ